MGVSPLTRTYAQQNFRSSSSVSQKPFYQGECDDLGHHHGQGLMKYSDGSTFRGIFDRGLPSHGLFTYLNGSTYQGNLKDNKPHGQGKWSQQKGIFSGTFQDGQFIQGIVKYTDGSYYKGKMNKMMKQGQGEFRFADGDQFKGLFKADYFLEGTYQSKDKSMCYQGQFNKDSQKHGLGKLQVRNVAEYQGNFKDDLFQGEGTLKNLKTNTIYKGGFQSGMKHGFGRLYGPQQQLIYQGDFKQNQKHGKGTFYHLKRKYQGQFQMGKFHGEGILHYGDGDVYKGNFKQNKKHGKGELILTNNTIQSYTGAFIQDKFQGQGQILYSNGDRYLGNFKSNKKHGTGTYSLHDPYHIVPLIKFQGQWFNDIKDGQFIETKNDQGKEIILKGRYRQGEKDGKWIVRGNGIQEDEVWQMGKKRYD